MASLTDQHLERGYEFSSCLSAKDFRGVLSSVTSTSNSATGVICSRLKESITVVESEVLNFSNEKNVWIHFKRYDELGLKSKLNLQSVDLLAKSCAFVVIAREALARLSGNSVPRLNEYPD